MPKNLASNCAKVGVSAQELAIPLRKIRTMEEDADLLSMLEDALAGAPPLDSLSLEPVVANSIAELSPSVDNSQTPPLEGLSFEPVVASSIAELSPSTDDSPMTALQPVSPSSAVFSLSPVVSDINIMDSTPESATAIDFFLEPVSSVGSRSSGLPK